MEWEDKSKMVQLGNAITDSDATTKEAFHNYVLEHISGFDSQAWDMFCNIVQIIPKEMKKDVDFWSKLYPHIKELDENNPEFNFRTSMRLSLIQSTCEIEGLI